MSAASDRFVQLSHGPIVPIEPLMLMLGLEARGVRLTSDGQDLVITPFSLLTDDDRQQLRRWKLHLLALVDYEVPVCA